MKKILISALVFSLLLVFSGSAYAQTGWSVAIEEYPGLTNCGNATNIPVAGATDCETAKAAAWNLLTTLLKIPGCLNPGCPPGSNITQGVSTCKYDPYTRPNGTQAKRWQISWTWKCVPVEAVKFDPCCPPWNKELLKEMLSYEGSSISSPYTLKFVPTSQFKNQMQTYMNYLHSLDSTFTGITIDWRLHDQGTGTLPSSGYGPQVPTATSTWYQTWLWNTTSGPLPSPATFFPAASMKVGTWYRIHTGIYLENGKKFFPATCANVEIFVRLQVMDGLKVAAGSAVPATLVFSDGKSVIRSIPITLGSNQPNPAAK
jgi:hypothetical protein